MHVQGNVAVIAGEEERGRTVEGQVQDSAGSASEGEQPAKGKRSETMAEMVDQMTHLTSVRLPILGSVVELHFAIRSALFAEGKIQSSNSTTCLNKRSASVTSPVPRQKLV